MRYSLYLAQLCLEKKFKFSGYLSPKQPYMGEIRPFNVNDGGQFTHWYRLYYPMVKKLVVEKGGTKEDAEDVFQETLIVLIEKKRNKEFNLTSKESTYVYGIALNKVRDY